MGRPHLSGHVPYRIGSWITRAHECVGAHGLMFSLWVVMVLLIFFVCTVV